jgi:zinc protease
MLKEPSFPEQEFEQLRQETIAAIEMSRTEPLTVAQVALQQHLSPYPKGHIRYVSTPDEEIAAAKAVTAAELKKFHADFYGASRAELAVVGDFDAAEIGKLAGDLFGQWKARTSYVRIPQIYKDVPAIERAFETPDKANAVVFAGMPLAVTQTDPDYPALILGNYLLGGGTLRSRFADRIRQKEGLSYAVGSGLSASPLDKSGTFLVFAICAPQNAGKVVAAFKDELAKALKDGFSDDELKMGKAGWAQSRRVGRAQDRALAGTLAGYLYLDRTMAWDAELERKVEALTADQVVAALRKYIDPARISFVKAGDFAKTAKGPGETK